MTRIMLAVVCVWLAVTGPGLAFAQRPSEPKPAAPEEKPKPSAPGKPAAPAPPGAAVPGGTPGGTPPQAVPRTGPQLIQPARPQVLPDGTWRYSTRLGGTIDGKLGGALTSRDFRGNVIGASGRGIGSGFRLGLAENGNLSRKLFEDQMGLIGAIVGAFEFGVNIDAFMDLLRLARTDDFSIIMGSYTDAKGHQVDVQVSCDAPGGNCTTTRIHHDADGGTTTKSTSSGKKGGESKKKGKKGDGIFPWPDEFDAWNWEGGPRTFQQMLEQELSLQGLQQPIGQPTK
jgi:hypothetical protein